VTTDAEAAETLRLLMSEISERAYSAGWMMELEFALWKLALRGGGRYGAAVVSAEEAATLRTLAERCGGWIAWSSEAVDEAWVPRDE